MDEKLLTISVAAYNAESTIERCLNSIIVQELMDDIEVIIVNDGSKDNTLAIASQFTNRYPNSFFIVDKENGGHGSTINTAIELATGKYFKVLDSDDLFNTDGFYLLLNELKKTDADIIFSPYQTVNNETGEQKKVFYLRKELAGIQYKSDIVLDLDIGKNLRIALAAITYKTSLLKDSSYRMDENCSYVDVQYALYYIANIQKIRLLPDIIYNYYIGSNEQSINIDNMIARRDQHLRVCEKLIDFYENEKNKMHRINEIIIRINIVNMILITEYRLLTTMDTSRCVKKEIRAFDKYLRNASKELYNEVEIQGMLRGIMKIKVIVLFRKVSFCGFTVFHFFFFNRMRRKL